MKLLIKNGRVIDINNKRDGLFDILVFNQKIIKIKENIPTSRADEIIDAKGLIVCPGFIDLHVHLREPGNEDKETIKTGSLAAAHGGFTSIACMPNTNPVNDTPEVTKYILNKIKTDACINVFPIAAVTKGLKGRELVDFKELQRLGVIGFSNDGFAVKNSDMFYKASTVIKEIKSILIEHPEDELISKNGVMHEGYLTEKYDLKGIPALSEDLIITRDLTIQNQTDSNLHLTHISTFGAFEMIKAAKMRGIRVTADVTPHHLLLNDEMVEPLNSVYKVKPPIRSETDRQAMIKGILTGIIDCIASDHAPHTKDEKSKDITIAPFGINGVETVFPLIFDRFVNKGIFSINKLIELLSVKPAQILNLKGKGRLEIGQEADITIIDPNQEFKISDEFFYSKATNSPFIGDEGKGAVAYTIVGGNVVYRRET